MAERVAVHKDLIVGLLEHLSQSVPKENVTKLNELLAANCRILRNEEIPMEPIDEDLQEEVKKLEEELEQVNTKVAAARARLPELRKRCADAVKVHVPDENKYTDEDGPSRDEEIPLNQIEDLRKWTNGALEKRAQKNIEELAAIDRKTERIQAAVTNFASSIASYSNGQGTPEPTVEIEDTPPSTPLSAARAAREAFEKRGLSLPYISPNVTPRSRRVRRTLSANRRASSMR